MDRGDEVEVEVEVEVLFCGVCHCDVHQVKNAWSNTVYPCMPGHEVVGRVARVGANVSNHTVDDLVGVGCMIDSCRECAPCREGDQSCEGPNSWLATYNAVTFDGEGVCRTRCSLPLAGVHLRPENRLTRLHCLGFLVLFRAPWFYVVRRSALG